MRRRLLQSLQQGVETVGGQHVYLINQVHLEPAPAGSILHVFQQVARIFDLGSRRGVHFQQIHETAFIDFPASGALTAGRGGNAGFTIQRLGENPRQRGFAHAASAGKQKGMMQSLPVERVGQRPHDGLLTDQLVKGSGPPFAGQNLIAHAAIQRADRMAHPWIGGQHILNRINRADMETLLEIGLLACWKGRRSLPAAPRRPRLLLPLLPSGPDGVHSLSSRGDRYGPPLKVAGARRASWKPQGRRPLNCSCKPLIGLSTPMPTCIGDSEKPLQRAYPQGFA